MKVYMANYAFDGMYRENYWWDTFTDTVHIFASLESAKTFAEGQQPKDEWEEDEVWKWLSSENPWYYTSDEEDGDVFQTWMIREIEIQ